MQRHHPRGGPGVLDQDVIGRVGNGHPAVDGDKGVAGDDHSVGEFGDRHHGPGVPEGGGLGGEVAVGIRPGGRGAVVDAEPEVLVDAVLDEEGPAETGDHPLVVALPADLRCGAVGAGERIRVQIEIAVVGRVRSGAGGAGGGGTAVPDPGVTQVGGPGCRLTGTDGRDRSRHQHHQHHQRRRHSPHPEHPMILAARASQRACGTAALWARVLEGTAV